MKLIRFIPLATLFLATVACKKEVPPPKRQPLPVTVTQPVNRDVIVYKSFPATLVGASEIEIRARVSGILEKAQFKEGDLVKKGTQLFVIEQEPYKLAVAAAEADVERSRASRDLAEKRFKRVEKAGKSRAVSEIDVDIAAAELAQAIASVNQTVAQLDQSQINVDYTTISAPVTGRMSRMLVDPGNLVGNGQATLLATIIDDSIMRAYFEVPERAMIRYLGQRAMEGGVERFADKEIRLTLADGSIYKTAGTIDFINNKIDSSTRTAQVRATFPNPEAELSSGLYGLVGFPAGPDPEDSTKTSALLVPAVSVQRDLGGDFVWIVDDQNTVRRRSVETGDTVEKPNTDPKAVRERETVINRGLEGSERVIVAGLQRARDGAVVMPQPQK